MRASKVYGTTTHRYNIPSIPLRVAIVQKREDREEDVEAELEDFEIGSGHGGY